MRDIRLSCVFPGEQLAAFDDAVRRLKDEGTHFNSDDSTYWFGLPPNLNRRVAELAALYEQEPHAVDEAIEVPLRHGSVNELRLCECTGRRRFPPRSGRARSTPCDLGTASLAPTQERIDRGIQPRCRDRGEIRRFRSPLQELPCLLGSGCREARVLRPPFDAHSHGGDILGDTAVQELTGAQKVDAETSPP